MSDAGLTPPGEQDTKDADISQDQEDAESGATWLYPGQREGESAVSIRRKYEENMTEGTGQQANEDFMRLSGLRAAPPGGWIENVASDAVQQILGDSWSPIFFRERPPIPSGSESYTAGSALGSSETFPTASKFELPPKMLPNAESDWQVIPQAAEHISNVSATPPSGKDSLVWFSSTTESQLPAQNNEKEIKPEVSGKQSPQSVSNAAPVTSDNPLNGFKSFLVMIGLKEPDVAPGKKRIRWTCICGKRFYEDFKELEPGALDRLGRQLNQSSLSDGDKRQHQQPNDAPQDSTAPSSSLLSSLWKIFGLSDKRGSENSQKKSDGSGTPQSSLLPTFNKPIQGQAADRKYVLICTQSGSFGVSFHHRGLQGVEFDHQLFVKLHSAYQEYRGSIISPLSLRCVSGIRFVKFAMMKGSDSADIQTHQGDCSKYCPCFPPKEKTQTQPPEYDFIPASPETAPPISPKQMAHFLSSQSCIPEGQKWIYKQVPKKLQGELVGREDGPDYGWGLYFTEDWHWKNIWLIMLLVFVFGSLIFAVLWTVLEKDIQGAFGVASWWISVGTISLGYFATRNL